MPEAGEMEFPAGMTRRELVARAALGMAGIHGTLPARPLLLPGPYRGKVVEVGHRDAVADGKVHRDAVRAMMSRGMRELTGEQSESAAWKKLFRPQEVVGVKVCPVGKPLAISQPETLLEVVRGLNLAGIRNENIVFFNRYEEEYRQAGFDKIAPAGVRQAFSSPAYDDVQTRMDGYDPAIFAEFPRVLPGQDASNPINRRSHLCMIVSQVVDKFVNVCVLKDHSSAGITMALKNMSHGLSNNVSRTHPNAALNWCDRFIPGVAALPRIRQKAVLHIGDALIAGFDGGPGNWNPHFRTWEYRTLFFATDPVAMDRIGWQAIDRKRAAEGLPPLAQTGRKRRNPGHELFDYRQPEHVLLAARAGLGEADLARIRHIRLEMG